MFTLLKINVFEHCYI